jgi:transitional endoplasmic reticulum ATPase
LLYHYCNETATATLLSLFKHKTLNPFEFRQFKTEILANYGIEFVQPTRGFESIGGYDFLKQYIRNNIILPMQDPDLAKQYGINVPKGLILFGPPGTGKTYFVKTLAKEVALPLLQLDPSTFLRGIVGETEQRIKQIQQIVESLAPCILFIDEIDQLFMSRANIVSTDSGVSRRMISMLLTWFGDENRKSIIIGTTNYIEQIDEAFLRPGRIDVLIPVLYPDYEARLQILQIHSKNKPVDKNALPEIAKKTAFYTSAELAYIIEKSLKIAFVNKVNKKRKWRIGG